MRRASHLAARLSHALVLYLSPLNFVNHPECLHPTTTSLISASKRQYQQILSLVFNVSLWGFQFLPSANEVGGR